MMVFSKADLQRLFKRKVLNQELSLRELGQRKIELASRPSRVLVELTENCNLRCPMCYQAHDPKYKKRSPALNMPMAVFEKVASELFDDAYFVDLRGFGETTILPYWPEIVDRLEAHPLINWHLVTNLSLPRDAVWEKMMREGFLLGFSCDGATKETFEAIRARSRFEEIIHNLALVTDCIKRHGKGHVYFIVTVQRKNIAELPLIVDLADRHGVREVQFKMVTGAYHDEGVPKSAARDLASSIDRSLDLAAERGIQLTLNDQVFLAGIDAAKAKRVAQTRFAGPNLNFPPPADLDPEFAAQHDWTRIIDEVTETAKVSVHKRCFKPLHYAYIASDGRVGTCNHMLNPNVLEMGDLKTQPFAEIWNNEQYRFFRGSLLYRKPIDDRCRWCFRHRLTD